MAQPLKILVCVKQVPDMESMFTVNADKTWIDEKDIAFRMNEFDEYAVEQAVRTKEQRDGNADITILSIGPSRVMDTIKKALAMGGDRGVHIRDDASHRKDPWQIASLIAAFARNKGFDLIFTGMQSQDRGSAQVGVFTAAQLGLACTTTAVAFSLDGAVSSVKRELEGGVKMLVKLTLPAVVTCQLGLNIPRYPTLPNIMKARQKELLVVQAADLPVESGLTITEQLHLPAQHSGCTVLDGTVEEMADSLIAILKQKTTVLR